MNLPATQALKTVFITGGTGYMGSRLIKRLLKKGYQVWALVRPGSEGKLPEGCQVVVGNALNADTYRNQVPQGCTFVHLVGVPHPSPRKKQLFESIDLPSVQAATAAAAAARANHFVYVSVAQTPTNIMKDYQRVRAMGEQHIRSLTEGAQAPVAGATFLRPWYVLGPGHWWPLLLLPFYWIGKKTARWREKAQALDLVWLPQMLNALEAAIHTAPASADSRIRIWEPREIARLRSLS